MTKFLIRVGIALLVVFGLWGSNSGQALTLGKTYDKSNWEEIQELLPPFLQNWVKKDYVVIKIVDVEELPAEDVFVQKSKKNEDKYDLNKDGLLINKNGNLVDYIEGMPFPTFDPKDPKAGAIIMENMYALNQWEISSCGIVGEVRWIGPNNLERMAVAQGTYFYYRNRRQGPIPNPNKFIKQNMENVQSPFDLRGTIQMLWSYGDERPDIAFAYIPMLRRVRRMSAATRSDPFLGSDICLDDS